MSLVRIALIALGVLALIALGLYIYNQRRLPGTQPLPVDPTQLVPNTWQLHTDQMVQCDFDNDAANDTDWLVPYSYDFPAAQAAAKTGGQIGAVVFIRQANLVPQNPATPSPYRPAAVLPYKLLPDIYDGKGQGYLGESKVWFQLWSGAAATSGCQAQEIAAWGKNVDADPNNYQRLSIFRWNPFAQSFDGVSYAASGFITATSDIRHITGFRTADRFDDRNVLCTFQEYQRLASNGTDQLPPLQFTEAPDKLTIDFCYGAPADPAYPEGVVVALLRAPDTPPQGSPGSGFFLHPNVSLPTDLQPLKGPARRQYRVLTVRNQGSLGPYPAAGATIPPPPGSNGNERDQWWQSGQQATVQTILVNQGGQERSVIWNLVSIANTRVTADTHWRITGVTEQ